MSEQKELIVSGPQHVKFTGRDSSGWLWFVNGHEVLVEISDTAMEIKNEYLGERLVKAKETQGRSEVERMSDWDVPNPHVILTTADD